MRFTSTILSNTEISPGYWRMRLSAPSDFLAEPGSFVTLSIGDGNDPLLRRPFGIFDTQSHDSACSAAMPNSCFDILYQVVGRGTNMLSSLPVSGRLDVIGPLGRGFDLGSQKTEKLIVGGGVGVAPLYLLAKELTKNFSTLLFVGGRTHNDILCVNEFERLGVKLCITTEDGSLGCQGLVTDALTTYLKQAKGEISVFACGPRAMLKAVASIAASHGAECQVSLEERMACAIGACLSCVTPGHNHTPDIPDYRCVCAEGPVFDARELGWGDI